MVAYEIGVEVGEMVEAALERAVTAHAKLEQFLGKASYANVLGQSRSPARSVKPSNGGFKTGPCGRGCRGVAEPRLQGGDGVRDDVEGASAGVPGAKNGGISGRFAT